MADGITNTQKAHGQGSAGTHNQPQMKKSSSSSNNRTHTSTMATLIDELDYHREFLDDMVAVMRDGNADSVQSLVTLIRSGVSKLQIHQAVQKLKNEDPHA
ncbi:uncharacterized protein N7511_005516 [Penicillium nucicola]|uniref:uncharacterized protein n=1 Tax=Penicillium nucicola TaxID=1850975 RepID=UPI0025458621|nr:uncharacterized protein N7511_005516 [Penicillium nucicola]KAJ5762134.1 hypothetical protein N7511_005516 [Penicillium nucicola]